MQCRVVVPAAGGGKNKKKSSSKGKSEVPTATFDYDVPAAAEEIGQFCAACARQRIAVVTSRSTRRLRRRNRPGAHARRAQGQGQRVRAVGRPQDRARLLHAGDRGGAAGRGAAHLPLEPLPGGALGAELRARHRGRREVRVAQARLGQGLLAPRQRALLRGTLRRGGVG
eukprot:2329300-Prymnesium_polylepis.1